jgi:hypothetical protein
LQITAALMDGVVMHVQIESIEMPSPMKIFNVVLLSYFFITAGVAYDIIHEPPAVGAHPDPVTGTSTEP